LHGITYLPYKLNDINWQSIDLTYNRGKENLNSAVYALLKYEPKHNDNRLNSSSLKFTNKKAKLDGASCNSLKAIQDMENGILSERKKLFAHLQNIRVVYAPTIYVNSK
jgi:hypothetical protein